MRSNIRVGSSILLLASLVLSIISVCSMEADTKNKPTSQLTDEEKNDRGMNIFKDMSEKYRGVARKMLRRMDPGKRLQVIEEVDKGEEKDKERNKKIKEKLLTNDFFKDKFASTTLTLPTVYANEIRGFVESLYAHASAYHVSSEEIDEAMALFEKRINFINLSKDEKMVQTRVSIIEKMKALQDVLRNYQADLDKKYGAKNKTTLGTLRNATFDFKVDLMKILLAPSELPLNQENELYDDETLEAFLMAPIKPFPTKKVMFGVFQIYADRITSSVLDLKLPYPQVKSLLDYDEE